MIKSLGEKHPDTKKASFIAPDSAILGDVTLAEGTSVWYGAVIRGDLDHITIGKTAMYRITAPCTAIKATPSP